MLQLVPLRRALPPPTPPFIAVEHHRGHHRPAAATPSLTWLDPPLSLPFGTASPPVHFRPQQPAHCMPIGTTVCSCAREGHITDDKSGVVVEEDDE